MDIELEKKAFQALFYRNKSERLLYDLVKGNGEFQRKLDHTYDNYINKDIIIKESVKGWSFDEILKEMKTHGVDNKYYVFSESSDYHRTFTTLAEVYPMIEAEGFSILLVGLPSGFSFFRGESSTSFRPSLFIKPVKRLDGQAWPK